MAASPVHRLILIRAMHPYGFRSGQWAELKGTADLPGCAEGDRACYLVEFPDGVADFWPVAGEEYGYEFQAGPP